MDCEDRALEGESIMMKKRDKTQGVVYVLPKSREFFGRISEDFEKVKLPAGSTPLLPEPEEYESEIECGESCESGCETHDESDIEALKDLKEHLSKLVKLQDKLKGLLNELDHLVKEE